MSTISISLTVNGVQRQVAADPNSTLLDLLRDKLGLSGVKDACGQEGECGACTVILDGRLVNSCLVLAGQVDGRQVITIEGLSPNGDAHPIQRSFVEAGAIQCGYCTPGAILSAWDLLERTLDPSDEQIREALSGNLCRCTGYSKMIQAVHQAAQELRHDR